MIELNHADNLQELQQAGAQVIQTQQNVKEKLLLQIKFLGQFKIIDQEGLKIKVYFKHQKCQQTVKRLIKQIDRDLNFQVLAYLTKINLLGNDLMELFIGHSKDQKLTYYLLVLMTQLTYSKHNKHPELSKNVQMYQAQLEYKYYFSRKNVLQTMLAHLSQCIQGNSSEKTYVEVVLLIVTLLRNVLVLGQSHSQQHIQMIRALARQKLLEVIIYISKPSSPFFKSIDLLLMQIHTIVFTAFSPEYLVPEEQTVEIKAVARSSSSRSSQFVGNFISKKTNRIYHTLRQDFRQPINEFNGQMRKMNNFKNSQRARLSFSQRILVDAKIESADELLDYAQFIRQLSLELLRINFNFIIKELFEEIYRFNPNNIYVQNKTRIQEYMRFNYFKLCSWGLRMVQQIKKVAKHPCQLQLACVLSIVQPSFFMLLYTNLRRPQKINRNKPIFTDTQKAAASVLTEYLKILYTMFFSFDPNIKAANSAILDNLFRHDLKPSMQFLLQSKSREAVLILFYYLQLLQVHTHGKAIMVQDRLTRKQPKKKKQKPSQQQGQQEKEVEEQEPPNYKNRKINEKNERASYFKYEIISFHISLLLTHHHDHELVKAVFSFLQKSVDRLEDGQFLLFQIEYMSQFMTLLDSPFSKSVNNIGYCNFIRRIFKSFLSLFQRNSLLPLEALFQTDSRDTLQLVKTNYQRLLQSRYDQQAQQSQEFNFRREEEAAEQDEYEEDSPGEQP